LAVVPNAEGLTPEVMQRIAREFNYSESTFVFGPEDTSHDVVVRIFMPTQEVPFAGHPNVGTAFVLAHSGALGVLDDGDRVVRFKELGGLVPVLVRSRGGSATYCELTAPQSLTFEGELPLAGLGDALGIPNSDIVTNTHSPVIASVGLAAAMVEVRDAAVLAKLAVSKEGWASYTDAVPAVHVYARAAPPVSGTGNKRGTDLQCRMFAPALGIAEDPATGSAVCALAGLLAHHDPAADGELTYNVRQGVEMGRPSELVARASKRHGEVGSLSVGGACVVVMEGTLSVD